jgi:hypothetical protein
MPYRCQTQLNDSIRLAAIFFLQSAKIILANVACLLKISFENRTGGSKVAWHYRQRDFAPLGIFSGSHVDSTLQVRAIAGNQIVWRDTQLHAVHTKFCRNQSDQKWTRTVRWSNWCTDLKKWWYAQLRSLHSVRQAHAYFVPRRTHIWSAKLLRRFWWMLAAPNVVRVYFYFTAGFS